MMTTQKRLFFATWMCAGLASCCTGALVRDNSFDWTVGTWEGVRRDAADGTTSPIIMRVEPLLGGGGQLRTLEVTGSGGRTYRGTAVQRVDPRLGRWVWQYSNSPKRPFARYVGPRLGTEIGKGRSEWRSVSPHRKRESRLVSEFFPDGSWRRTLSVSTDGGVTWRSLWIDELRRLPSR